MTRSWPPRSHQSPPRCPTTRSKIASELIGVQGSPMEFGGYYLPDDELAAKAMRPSRTLNAIIDAM